jgi:hypothetical protein
MALIFIAVINSYLWYSGEKAKQEAPAKAEKKRIEDEKNDKAARDTLWYNRFGIATRPLRSVDNFMTLIGSEKTLNEAFDYTGYEGTVSTYEDYQQGLDGIASEEDKKMMEYYKESLKHKSHH